VAKVTAVITRQRAQEVHDMARARAGLPYSYGGAFTRDPRVSTDCSGLVLQTAAWYMGRTDWPGNRYGSTESFRLNHRIVAELGFKRLPKGGIAELGFTPVMLVGLQHGGGGVYSHTACTLMTMDAPGGPVVVSQRGVDWESQGDGVFLYDGARAWNDPLFHDFWYLDAKLEASVTAPPSATLLSTVMGASVSMDRYRALAPAVAECLRQCGCTTVERVAMWCAQIGHESGGLRYMEEIADGSAYEGRADLGNTQPGDGRRFRGRGPLQVTGRHNYTKLSKWAYDKGLAQSPTFFVDQPEQLSSDRYGFVGTQWYWTVARPSLNVYADNQDLEQATRAINGGLNGLDDRRARYQRGLTLPLLQLLTTGDDMAQVPQDQWDRVYRELTQRLPSRSIYRTPGEGTVDTFSGMVLNLDAMTHADFIERLAKLGDPDAIGRLARVAAGQGAVQDEWAVEHAKAVLAQVPEQFLTSYLGARQ
jgi:predicted chitinase